MVGRKRKAEYEDILALKQAGLSHRQIADELDICISTVKTALKQFKGQYDLCPNTGRNKIDITDYQRLCIFELKAAGYYNKDIAEKVGLSQTIVGKILKGKR